MKKLLHSTNIRTRLVLVFSCIILIGFGASTLLAGQQIAAAARVDYGQQLQSTVLLIAQGLASVVHDMEHDQADSHALDSTFASYESQINGTLKFYPLFDRSSEHLRDSFRDSVELETALRGQIVLVERNGEDGTASFFTAAPIVSQGELLGLLQLQVPSRNLLDSILQRWLALGAIFALIAVAAVASAFWLASSIIQPLAKLRESAHRLAQGNFSHRVNYEGKDEIGQVAHAFNEMAQQVESMLEEQRAFASNTSHELRTPLTTIRLRTEALRYDSTLDPLVFRRYIEEIDDEVVRLGHLVQDLTLLSRLDAGRAELGQEQIDLARLAVSLQHQFSQQMQVKNITFNLHLPATPLLVNGSLNHMIVLFRNVLDNAVKYTPADRQIDWQIEAGDGGIRSRIRDTGRGISSEDLAHVFERFYRVDKARSREIPGTGLGLALANSIVNAYKGTISIDSAGIDQGTIVTIFLPRSDSQQAATNRQG